MRRRLRRGAASAAALVLALGAAEGALRWLGLPRTELAFLGPELGLPAYFVADDALFWRLQPGAERFDVNAAGLRGWWPAHAKAPEDWHLLCVGDSCTFGSEVRYEEAYGVQLERRVQQVAPQARVRAVLLALPGYSTFQSRRLLDRHLGALAPDVTVFYCGAWNDLVPAVGLSDAQRAATLRGAGALRLWRVARAVLAPGPTRAEIAAQARAGAYEDEPPHGRRVPRPAFAENMRAMIAQVRAAGSQVVVVVPPRPADVLARFTAGRAYNDALRAVAAETGAALLDGQALLEDFAAGCPPPWRTHDYEGQPLPVGFNDRIHPSPAGHALLARALHDLLAARGWLPPPRALEAPPLAVDTVEPARLEALGRDALRVHGTGLDDARVQERIWLGPRWVRAVAAAGPGELELRVPALPPGTHVLELRRPGRAATASVEVAAPPLDARLVRRGDGLWLEADGRAPPGWVAGVWLAASTRAAPTPTAAGAFRLAADRDGRPPGRTDLPFRFDLLGLPFLGADEPAAPDGRWHVRRRVADATAPTLPDRLFAQALLQDNAAPDTRLLTALVEIALPD